MSDTRAFSRLGTAFVVLSLLYSPVRAVEWVGTTGNFDDGANWQGGSPPEFGEDAVINNGGTVQFNSDSDELQSLDIGLNGGSGAFEQSGGVFIANGAFIGDSGTGTATLSDGEFMIGGNSIHVGYLPTGSGTLNITGEGAIVKSGDDFQLGREGTGTLNFSAGELRAGFTVIGKFGTGIWNQTGGLFDQDFGDVEIGDGGRDDQAGTAGPRVGTLSFSGGVLQTAGSLAIGNRQGSGEVNVSGGILAATGSENSTIYIGRGMDSSPGVGGPTSLRITGDDALIAVTGDLLMNVQDVASSSTWVTEITGPSHSVISVAGDIDVTNGTLKVELNGYTPVADDSWILAQAGVDLDPILEEIDTRVDAMGYAPLTHAFPVKQGVVSHPFLATDTSMAALSPGLDWEVSYTDEFIVLTVIGTAVLPGDYNADGVLDAADVDLQALAMNDPMPDLNVYDENDDGLVDSEDRIIWVQDLAKTWFGDANFDGSFTSDDLVVVFAAGKYETQQAANWSEGDWDGDLVFDSADLVAAFADGGYELGPRPPAVAAVPEPSSLALLGMAALAGLTWRRSRRG